mgnify:CR=1 FL=1
MKTRGCLSEFKTSFLLVTVLLIMGGTATLMAQEGNEVKAMAGSLLTASKTESPAIPPIDAKVPADFQTASFGLG